MKRTLVLGGPGAGKTKRLIDVVKAAIERGVKPERIALVAFTRAAAYEARDKVMAAFGLTEKDLPYFRTTHSLCFRELGLRRGDVMAEEDLAELAEITGELRGTDRGDDGPATRMSADSMMTLDHYARATKRTLREAWENHGGVDDWFRLKRFSDAYTDYRKERRRLDFTDMLVEYNNSQLNATGVDVAIVDEGQDLTELQHDVIAKAFAAASEFWIAGDDMQSIHRWAGAAEERFLTLPYEREVLPISHRLPRAAFALSEEIAGRVSRRYEKAWTHSGREGSVEWVGSVDEVDLSKGTWLLMARTRAQLAPLVELARDQGVTYRMKGEGSVDPAHVEAIKAHEALRAGKRVDAGSAAAALSAAGVRRELDELATYTAAELKYDATPIWHDALVRIALDDREYYLACMRRGEKLTEPPRVRIDTVHGAKGLEAQNSLLATDMSYRTRRGYELDPDSEHRVWYVGTTRASEHLVMVAPQGAYGYQM